MTENLRKSLDELRQLAPELNKATDDAKAVVEVVEKFLNEECSLGLHCSVWLSETDVPLDEGETGTRSEQKYLAYARVEGRFRIAVEISDVTEWPDYQDPDVVRRRVHSEGCVPWASCPRDLKLETFAALPELLETIAREGRMAIKRTADTSKTVEQVLEALGTDRAPSTEK